MKDEIERLVQQFQILESAAAEKTGAERAALQKRAAEIKMEIIKLLPKQGQQSESKVPGLDYFDNKLDPAFGDYFSGDYLTPDMRDYFTVKVPDNAPDERPSTETPKSYAMDEDVRRRIFNAIGIPC
ncbi:hypothetical protein [Escherichia coli]|uniref:hypothetical protein n=1 Tax=Escherichia coli TaxID=562 RepID=UPI0005B3D925|nr:hypothetical protein [Escherichia coli]EEV2838151.1 hypothetical protein [Escherichia coli O43:H2]EKH5964113.1 hypothetical protein [Escherichia coli O43]AWJ49883.1 hypothetical protein I3W_15950 [Escherichia coli O43 str. RM10042]EEQ2862764.1 hypothetical protein [Escherichia coli]EEQ4435338.1 hypothetical protein [Escherichia coli]